LRSEKYKDHLEVIEKTRWVNGPGGAACTGALKKEVRFAFQQVDDIQYFGYTAGPREVKRAERFKQNFPEVKVRFPLIEQGLTKEQCAGIILKAGIVLPILYIQGFNNNNCIGCVKGGKGYWNKIRILYPDSFDDMAKMERKVGASCIKGRYLDELKENEGNHKDFEIGCDFVCENVAVKLADKSKTPAT